MTSHDAMNPAAPVTHTVRPKPAGRSVVIFSIGILQKCVLMSLLRGCGYCGEIEREVDAKTKWLLGQSIYKEKGFFKYRHGR